MIIPLPIVSLALASRIPLQQRNLNTFTPRKSIKPQRYSMPKGQKNFRPPDLPASLRSLIQGLSKSLSGLTRKNPSEDYDAIVKDFLPSGAAQLEPQYPAGVGKYLLADLDGDTQNELVTTYRLGDTNTTIVLKKAKDKWTKKAEIENKEFSEINFMSAADVSGDKRSHLLIGWKSKEGSGKLHGYSLNNDTLEDAFSHDYNYLEVLPPDKNRKESVKAQLALWNRKENSLYDVSVKHWTGTELQQVSNQNGYYYQRVLPYYGRAVKKMPGNPTNWLNLAKALEKAELYGDALRSAEIGLSLNPSVPVKGEFESIRGRMNQKMKPQ